MYTNRRIFIAKCAFAAFILYLIVYISTNKSATHIIRQLQQSGRNLAALDPQQAPSVEADQLPILASDGISQGELLALERAKMNVSTNAIVTTRTTTTKKPMSVLDKVKEVTKCLDKPLLFKTQQRGDYWVLYNYIQAERTFKCHESITYTTHADYSFMDNLVPLIERWQGPLSIALHAPGTDFKNTLDSIAYLRDCTDSLVKEFVTFHIYFSTKHVPKEVSIVFFRQLHFLCAYLDAHLLILHIYLDLTAVFKY